MNQLFRRSEARGDQNRNTHQGKELIAGIAVLLVMMGAVGCGADPEGSAGEPIDSVSQDARWTGLNGIPPEVLKGGYLAQGSTNQWNITTPMNPSLIRLCENTGGPLGCDLKNEWTNWLNQSLVWPPSDDTMNRYHLIETLIKCATTPEFTVHIPAVISGYDAVQGMFGLAPQWGQFRLGLNAQELMSACIASRVNQNEGAHVPYGVVGTGPGPEAPLPIENDLYTHQEGVFAGNLFGFAPKIVSCSGRGGPPAVAAETRECTRMGNFCNIQALGPCDLVCTGGWEGVGIPTGEYCTGIEHEGATYNHLLTVYLEVISP